MNEKIYRKLILCLPLLFCIFYIFLVDTSYLWYSYPIALIPPIYLLIDFFRKDNLPIIIFIVAMSTFAFVTYSYLQLWDSYQNVLFWEEISKMRWFVPNDVTLFLKLW